MSSIVAQTLQICHVQVHHGSCTCSPSCSICCFVWFIRRVTVLLCVPVLPRSTLSTEGQEPASLRPSASSPRASWPTKPFRMLQLVLPPQLLRERLAGIKEFIPSAISLVPQATYLSDLIYLTHLQKKMGFDYLFKMVKTSYFWPETIIFVV